MGPVPSALRLAPFYKKYLDGDGIPIVSSDKVSDRALLQARFLARQMLVRLPAVREELKNRELTKGRSISTLEMMRTALRVCYGGNGCSIPSTFS